MTYNFFSRTASQLAKARKYFHKKPLGRRWYLMSSSVRTANLVPLRLERSESAASLEYFLAGASLRSKCSFTHPNYGTPPVHHHLHLINPTADSFF